jgi:hypothetical protein
MNSRRLIVVGLLELVLAFGLTGSKTALASPGIYLDHGNETR